MRKNVLLTSFGGVWSLAFYEDFLKRGDYRVFFADVDPAARAQCFARDFFTILPPSDPDYTDNLFAFCKKNDIRFVIPGADEEVLRLMPERKRFEKAGILVAAQDMELSECFSSKSRMYDLLRAKGVPVPFYKRFRTGQEFEAALSSAEYPSRPLLVKPDNGRGSRRIVLLSERVIPNKDQLHMMNSAMFHYMIDGKQEFIAMDYLEGDMYDADVLTYDDGSVFFGLRKRFTNIALVFKGNIFESHERIEALCRQLHNVLPTRYLIDYDIMVPYGRPPVIIEINPRPSGSTISYLPFGYNLYHILIQTYLDQKKTIPDGSYIGRTAHAFHRVLKDVR